MIMGQCLPAMKNKIERLDDYKDLEDKNNVIGLLKKMQEVAFSADSVQYEFWLMQQSMRKLATCNNSRRRV